MENVQKPTKGTKRNSATAERHSTVLKGKYAEDIAAKYLADLGFEILQRNFRFKHAEIDIIGIQNNELVFIEVKSRSRNKAYQEYPEQAVSKKKQNLIFLAAEEFAYTCGYSHLSFRFDIVAIQFFAQKTPEITHIKDAFRLDNTLLF